MAAHEPSALENEAWLPLCLPLVESGSWAHGVGVRILWGSEKEVAVAKWGRGGWKRRGDCHTPVSGGERAGGCLTPAMGSAHLADFYSPVSVSLTDPPLPHRHCAS